MAGMTRVTGTVAGIRVEFRSKALCRRGKARSGSLCMGIVALDVRTCIRNRSSGAMHVREMALPMAPIAAEL